MYKLGEGKLTRPNAHPPWPAVSGITGDQGVCGVGSLACGLPACHLGIWLYFSFWPGPGLSPGLGERHWNVVATRLRSYGASLFFLTPSPRLRSTVCSGSCGTQRKLPSYCSCGEQLVGSLSRGDPFWGDSGSGPRERTLRLLGKRESTPLYRAAGFGLGQTWERREDTVGREHRVHQGWNKGDPCGKVRVTDRDSKNTMERRCSSCKR